MAMLFTSGLGYSQNTFPTNGNVGIGTLSPAYNLDIFGNVRITNNLLVGGGIITASVLNTSGPINAGDMNITNNMNVSGNSILGGSLTISSMVGFDNFEILVNPAGQLFKGSKKVVTECVTNAPAWFMGGNNILPVIVGPNPVITSNDIGTCNNFDFILKSNNIFRQWIKPDGTIGFGTNITSNTGGAEYKFNAGALRLSSMNTYGGPQIVFDGGQNLFGDWGIEYLAAGVPGLNFWKPYGSPNSYDYMLFLADDGKVSVGAVTNSASARFNVDAWSGDGIKSSTDASLKAYTVFNKSANIESFVVYGNGATHLGRNAQIGFSNTAIQDQNNALNVNHPNINGIRLFTNPSQRAYAIFDYGTNNESFVVYGNGATHMGANAQIGYSNEAIQNPNTALNINHPNFNGLKFNTTNPNVNIISVNSDLPGASPFTVKANGQTYIGTQTLSGVHMDAMLQVGGKIACKSLFVLKPTNWADKVFSPNYELIDLNIVDEFIQKNHCLPDIKSEKEILENGYDLNEMDASLLEKSENLYLYAIKQHKELEKQKAELANLKAEINELKASIKSVKE